MIFQQFISGSQVRLRTNVPVKRKKDEKEWYYLLYEMLLNM